MWFPGVRPTRWVGLIVVYDLTRTAADKATALPGDTEMVSIGKHKYGNISTNVSTVCADENGTHVGYWKSIIVSCQIVKPEGKIYCTKTHRTVIIGCDECVSQAAHQDTHHMMPRKNSGWSCCIVSSLRFIGCVTLSQQSLMEHENSVTVQLPRMPTSQQHCVYVHHSLS